MLITVRTNPSAIPDGGLQCNEWFGRWQEAKKARRSRVRVNNKRGGAESTAARDRACWSKWWAPTIGQLEPHVVTQRDITKIVDSMEVAGLAPLTINTHWDVVKAFFGWLADENVIEVSPIAKASMSVDLVSDRVREIVVPDFRFIEMLSNRLGSDQDRLVFELLLGTGGRRSEVAGMVVGDVDLSAKRVWVRQPVVEVEGRLVRNSTPKGGREPRRGCRPAAGSALARTLASERSAGAGRTPLDQRERRWFPLERLSVPSPSPVDLLHCSALGCGGAQATNGSRSEPF